MSPPKRKGPSRLMASMQSRVEDLGDSLIPSSSSLEHSFEVQISDVEPDPQQARKQFSTASLKELAASLLEHGQLMPVLVRPKEGCRGKWILVAGERRWRAAKLAGIAKLVAIKRDRDHDVASLIENLQREDLTPLEESLGIFEVMSRKGWSQREAAKQLGRAVSDINGILKVRELPTAFLEAVIESEHPPSRNLLIELSRIPEGSVRDALLKRARKGELTIPDIRAVNKESVNIENITVKPKRLQPKIGLRSASKFEAELKKLEKTQLDDACRSALKRVAAQIAQLLSE